MYSMRSVLFEASLWLILASLALESRRTQREINDRMERFMVQESKLEQDIESYKAKPNSKITVTDGPQRDPNFTPPMGIY
jgi:hypothetical protein